MSKKKKKKVQGSKNSFAEVLTDKKPILRFFGLFGLFLLLFYLFYYSSFYENYLQDYLLNTQASLASGVLNLLGYASKVSGDQIYTQDFNIGIKGGCDGVEATALFILAILAFPVKLKSKLVGMVVGVLVLFCINIFRISGLFVVGTHYYEVFEAFHLHGGVVLFTLVSIVIWIIWANWSIMQLKTA